MSKKRWRNAVPILLSPAEVRELVGQGAATLCRRIGKRQSGWAACQPGDRLWGMERFSTKEHASHLKIRYAADGKGGEPKLVPLAVAPKRYWTEGYFPRAAHHMPRWAARLFLEVVGVQAPVEVSDSRPSKRQPEITIQVKLVQGARPGLKAGLPGIATPPARSAGNRSRVRDWLRSKKAAGASHRTFNAYLTAIQGFCRWLVLHRRMPENPLAHLSALNEADDRRRERTALPAEEFARLVQAARQSPRVFRQLTGARGFGPGHGGGRPPRCCTRTWPRPGPHGSPRPRRTWSGRSGKRVRTSVFTTHFVFTTCVYCTAVHVLPHAFCVANSRLLSCRKCISHVPGAGHPLA